MEFDISRSGLLKKYTGDLYETVEIPEGTREIGEFAFLGTGLERVIIPEGVEIIGAEAFSGCSYLKSVVFPNSLKKIQRKAFRYCPELEDISLPPNLERIGDEAFIDCVKLKEMILPESLITLERNCVPKNLLREFNGGYYLGSKDNNYYCLVKNHGSKPEFHENTKLIAGGVFEDPKSIEKIILSEGIKHLSLYAFENCQALEQVVIEGIIEEIPITAFSKCDKATIFAPKMKIEEFDPALKRKAIEGFIDNTDLFLDDEIVSGYISYIASKLNTLAPLILAKDNSALLLEILRRKKLSPKKKEELLKLSIDNHAEKCNEALKQ